MKLVSLACPSCGAQLKVDMDEKRATCEFCGATFPIEDDVQHVHQHVQYENAGEAGYEFEMGRQRAMAEIASQQQVEQPSPAKKPEKKTSIVFWVLGWIFIFPVPLTVLMLRNKKINSKVRIAVIILAWALYLSFNLGHSRSGNEAKDTSDGDTIVQVETQAEEENAESAEDAQESNADNANNTYSAAIATFIDKFNAVTMSPLSGIEIIDADSIRCETSGRRIDVYCPNETHCAVSVVMDKTLGNSWIKYVVHDFAQAFDPDSADALEDAWYRAAMSEDTATDDLEVTIGAMTLNVSYGMPHGRQEVDRVTISWDAP